MSSDPDDLKVRHLDVNPRAALVIDEPPPAKSGVKARGAADVFREGELFELAQDHLMAAGAHSKTRKAPGEQVYVRLTPRFVAAWRVG